METAKNETRIDEPTGIQEESQDAKENAQTVQETEEKVTRQPYIEIDKDERGEWHWCLFSGNGRPMAANVTPFKRRNDCQKAIETMLEITRQPKLKITASIN